MKYIILVFALCLCSSPGFALSRQSATPILHSVLDPVAASNWSMRPSVLKPASLPVADEVDGLTRKQWRHFGKGITIVGGCIILIGGGILGYGAYHDGQNPNAEGGLGVYVAGALIAIVGAFIALFIGLPIWLTHLH